KYFRKNKISLRQCFIFDCCFSGGIAKKGKSTRGSADVPIPEGSNGTVKQDAEDFFFQDKAIISSADDNQTAIEVGGSINHGIFTYNFGRALGSADLNKDNVVTALEAFFKSKEETVQMAKKFQHEQVPQISGNASGIFLSGKKIRNLLNQWILQNLLLLLQNLNQTQSNQILRSRW
ncbi:caspase domain protein, partial [Leptospira interrogans serovar Icterohaemorrhagiae str. Verdun HP]